MRFGSVPKCFLCLIFLSWLPAASALPQSAYDPRQSEPTRSAGSPQNLAIDTGVSNLVIPRLTRAPAIDDFLSMRPEGEIAPRMVKVTHFEQREPHDGQPVSQPTAAYLGYDDKNLYVVFVCYDDPAKIRAHETRREDFVGDDDDVEIMLDTFHDRRRAYVFQVNPKGVQFDAIWTEASYADTGGNFDSSFDTLWYSKGKLTPQGYVAWIAIPFRSLRFPSVQDQTWGILLLREITRDNEKAFWPHVSINEDGRLGHAAIARGLTGISPGRNIQLIPYGLLNSFHSVDDRGPNLPCPTPFDPGATCAHFQNRDIGGTFGLDGKMILNDSLVLDVTANPDFSQVESDEPQVTVNQRYRVYFPEKRPFFIENSDYFRTPIDLFFTRNIVNPDAGIRLTGKVGPYSLGLLSADDRADGLIVGPDDPLFMSRSYFTIARVSRDIFNQSSVGAIYTDYEDPAANTRNRVGGIDTRLKFSNQLTATGQAVVSSTDCAERYSDDYATCLTGHSAGPAYKADLTYTSRHWFQDSTYNDVSPGFSTFPGFVNRVDLREYRDDTSYTFRPTSGPVVSWGPEVFGHWTWDHTGLRLDTDYNPVVNIVLKRQTRIFLLPYEEFRERLRPKDFAVLCQPDCRNQDYHEHNSGATISSAPLPLVTLGAQYFWGDSVNFIPGINSDPQFARYTIPYLAHSDTASAIATIHPFTQLKIDNTYLFSRLRLRDTDSAIFNNHIIRSKWNWQFTRELSLRVILQYTATLTQNNQPNPQYLFTVLPTSRNFNTDVLITYLLHPGTALYIGYNSNLQNLNRSLTYDPRQGAVQSSNNLINDGRLFFVKLSYLLRF